METNHQSQLLQEWKPFLEPPKNLRAVSKAAAAAPTPLWLFPFSLPHLYACSSPPVHLPQAVKICLVHLWPPQKKVFASPILLHNILLLLGSFAVWETDKIPNPDNSYDGHGYLDSSLMFLAALEALSGTE